MKDAAPEVGVMCDVALDPFTEHGHDGVVENGRILNDATIERLVEQGLMQAKAGCDILAPSDMMDGRVGALRAALEAEGLRDTHDHVLRRQIRLGLLRPLSRGDRLGKAGHRLDRQSRRQGDLPDGSGQLATRRCARWRSTSPRAPTW